MPLNLLKKESDKEENQFIEFPKNDFKSTLRVYEKQEKVQEVKPKEPKNQSLQEIANLILDTKIKNNFLLEHLRKEFPEFEEDCFTYAFLWCYSIGRIITDKRASGSVKIRAFKLIMETAGQMPSKRTQKTTVNLQDLVDENGYINIFCGE